MDKRGILRTGLAFLGAASLTGSRVRSAELEGENVLEAGGSVFNWHHEGSSLTGSYSAPTPGWVAVGFNERRELQNTHFIIAAVSTNPVRIEEHVALVPEHREVSALGVAPALVRAGGTYRGGTSNLEFSLPHRFPGRPGLSLAPGGGVHLMLAWSHEPDFGHHSAWRQHFDITL